MSKIALTPNGSGSGVFTIASPNSNTNRTITLPDESVTLGAGTPSIDDNGTGTRMTIGSGSDNAVMVGTTISNPVSNNVQGISFRGAYGEVQISSEGSSGAPLYLNRKSSDGVIEVFRKDGNDVGSIGVSSDGASFGNATQHVAMHSGKLFPASPTHSTLDNTIDLGYSAGRYKDLYLSGGIYLGGTGSANHLDDYETGTFTPSVQTGSISAANGIYVKIGDFVYCSFTAGHNMDTTSSNQIKFGNLPFANGSVAEGSNGSVFCRYSNAIPNAVLVDTSATTTRMFQSSSGAYHILQHSDLNNSASALFYIQVTYRTN
jgi:hypothetical protein